MATTYTLINSNVLTADANSVSFSSIPATYTDLVLRISARSTRAATDNSFTIKINGATTNYSYTDLYGNGSSASSSRGTGGTSLSAGIIIGDTDTANTYNSIEIYIPSYTASQSKPISTINAWERNATAGEIHALAQLYSSSTAITSVSVASGDGTWDLKSGSSFYLYGISSN